MYRERLAWLLAAAAIVGALSCDSREPREEAENVSSANSALAAGSCSICLDIHLGDYNLFLLEDYTGGHNVGGKVAAGGNITMTDFSVGMDLPASPVPNNTLVAGGNLTLQRGGFRGNAWYGGSYTSGSLGCTSAECPATQGAPIDFAARFAGLRSLSSRLATQPINGLTELKWGGVLMSGTDPCLNVFEVKASALSGGEWWNLDAPSGSLVVINIRGTAFTFPTNIGGTNTSNSRRVLYNFVEATSLTANPAGFGAYGTALAPYAHVTFAAGAWYGGIYAASLSGAVSISNSPLDELAGGAIGAPELCNGADDNCDGQVDEGFECTGSGNRSCTAWCGAAGTQSCNPTTCGYGVCTSSSCCRVDADCASGSYCAGTTCAPVKGNAAACSSASQCSSGNCVDGVCCDTACGGECDACNLAGQVGTCSMVPATVQCRASGGECDVAEFCTGTAAACPANGAQASGVACTSDGNACTTDACDGTGSCSHPLVAAGTACGSGQVCNATGVCASACWIGGVSYAAGATNPGAACQVCNPSVSTSSWSAKASGTACTSDGNACTSDVCDAAGSCTHPTMAGGTSCGSGQICNATGVCGSTCLIGGVYYAAGTSNPAAECQVCNPSVSTSGWSFKPATAVCRGSADVCDAAEYCTGSSATCPADAKKPATTVCRGSADVCDVAEYCTGSSDTCPGNGYAPSTTVCRPQGGECGLAELCTGTGPSCPTDRSKAYGTACTSDGNVCTSDVCNGAGSCSHPPEPEGSACGSGLVCSASGVCGLPPVPPNMCLIGGTYYSNGDANPGASCQVCNPNVSNTSWSAKASGAACTSDSNACTSDVCNGSGSCTHPVVSGGTSCGSGQICNAAGACMNQCLIGGVYYNAGHVDENAPCQVCNPSQSTSSWSLRPAGTMCYTPTGSPGDMAAYCTGSSKVCEDSFAPKPVDCRNEGVDAPFGTACSGDSSGETCNFSGTCSVRWCNPLTDNACFLKQSYRDVFNRKADSWGLEHYLTLRMNECVAGQFTTDACWKNRADILYDFITSAESKSFRHPRLSSGNLDSKIYQRAFIKALYYDLLRRLPQLKADGTPICPSEWSPGCSFSRIGLNNSEVDSWMGHFNGSGYTPEHYKALIKAFLKSTPYEYERRFPNP
ncbi:choice-of-anchor A family protein [Archangium lansingense]|uniref:Choice-of-anchor A family protein n=1 Tax=Archangium lansingense TaxID=2995310 RepID=A0ABT4A4W3_9BACT|nr:choice-of-anchor A family protein [Archangium lansinium]MCY1076029.1 choice-of-anchor A family protein [Archangium lansinium]